MISKYCAKIINVWNFSDPIVEVMLSSSEGPMRKIWQYMCENLEILENNDIFVMNRAYIWRNNDIFFVNSVYLEE
jgi:hypothetical protein